MSRPACKSAGTGNSEITLFNACSFYNKSPGMLTRGFCNLCTSVFSFLMQHSLPAACFLPLFLLYIIARSFFLPVAETVLSVPFVAETVDLVSKFGKIFVGAAFVSCNNRKQPLTSRNEAVEDGISAASRAQGSCICGAFFLDRNADSFLDKFIFFQIKYGSGERSHRRITEFIPQFFCKSSVTLSSPCVTKTRSGFARRLPAHLSSPS